MKKQFVKPEVLQQVEVLLEENFLQGPSNISSAITTGQEKEEVDINSSWLD